MFKTVLTIGTFDIPHIGHAVLFERCKELASLFVYVGVNSDRFVGEYKGERPLYTQDERMAMVRELGVAPVLNDGPGADLIKRIKPEAVVIGSDWLNRDYLRQIAFPADEFDKWGIALIYLPYTKGISTSDIKQRLESEQEAHRG